VPFVDNRALRIAVGLECQPEDGTDRRQETVRPFMPEIQGVEGRIAAILRQLADVK
jgi:hypothetical protein